ncbi:MAG: sensor domain-containing diguanylate cyclase [Zoogloea sp.]|uniref:sensor domain-containing diguanylate cyclase n=1 Tax=Zoogloea sp. TaxID=49181 RepID=UPI00262D63A0|nr:sensor domain-containing diguanylate cyclase [Zoogloea sp.]MDD2989032.1 sensor domain-containing diguanylate cyclase [Zoogloea sp.]
MKPGSLSLLRTGTDVPHAASTGQGRHPDVLRSLRRAHLLGQLASVVTVVGLWPHIASPWQLLLWWLGASISQALLARTIHPTRLARSGTPIHDPFLRHYLLSAIAAVGGGAWGTLALVGPYEAGPQAQAILFMALGGVTLAGAGILFASRSACAVFVTAAQLPLFIQTVVNPPASLPHASLFLGVFVLFALTLNDLIAASRDGQPQIGAEAAELASIQQAMLDNTTEAIVLSHGHRIQRWNQHFPEVMHWTRVNIAGRRLAACFSSRAEWRRHARAAIDTLDRGETYRTVTRLRRGDGSDFWAEISGRRAGGSELPAHVVWTASDISERVSTEARDNLAHTELAALLRQSADWYWETDSQHRLMQIAPLAMAADDSLQHHIGRRWWQFQRSGQSARLAHGVLRKTFEQRDGFRDLPVDVPDGSHTPRRLQLSGTPRHDEHGSFTGYHGIATDVTERIRDRERIHFLAYYDALTSLPNRRLLMDRLGQSIARAQRYQEYVGVILVDVDDFKRINDLAGHGTGDRILVEMADRLRHSVRSCDTVARLEGDAFVILLPELETAGAAQPVAAKLLSILLQPLVQPSPRNMLGASLGIATFPNDASNAEDLLRIADGRMLRAKRRGGQRIECA